MRASRGVMGQEPGRPDPDRIGGLAWTRRTQGVLSPAERRALLGAIARGQVTNLMGRVKLALGRVPVAARDLSMARFVPPDSGFARKTEEACAEQPASIVGHSYRTWIYGSALLALDQAKADPELFYAACLLHDAGLSVPVPGEDFTLRSSARAAACARAVTLSEATIETLEDAITVHTTPGIDPQRDGALGFYLQAGAMVDLAGFRAWDLSPALIAQVLERHPRLGFTAAIDGMFRAEAAALPEGRFAFVARWGFLLAVRVAPFREK